eukprot:gene17185-20440_t
MDLELQLLKNMHHLQHYRFSETQKVTSERITRLLTREMVMSKYTPPGNPPPMTTQCYCCKMEKQQKGSFFSMLQNRTDTEDLNQELGGLTAMLKLNGFPAWERSFSKGWIRPFLALVRINSLNQRGSLDDYMALDRDTEEADVPHESNALDDHGYGATLDLDKA